MGLHYVKQWTTSSCGIKFCRCRVGAPGSYRRIQFPFLNNNKEQTRKWNPLQRDKQELFLVLFIKRVQSKDLIWGAPGRVSDSWAQLRSWSHDHEFKCHAGLHAGLGLYFKKVFFFFFLKTLSAGAEWSGELVLRPFEVVLVSIHVKATYNTET